MKIYLKLLAVLSAVAIFTAVTPGPTAYANIIGWEKDSGIWRFYEEADYYVTDSWKKSGNDWYYLNTYGELATNTTIDDYYVDGNGKRVINQWISVENTSHRNPSEPEHYWQYYGNDGKLTKSKWKKINNLWYYFNEKGTMLSGWVNIDNNTYYLGGYNDGSMKTGWVRLENQGDTSEGLYSWYYFERDGEMVKNQIDKKIDGYYYTFVNGKMQTGWYKVSSGSSSPVTGYQYYLPSGARAEGWRNIEGVPSVSLEDEFYWFYFKKGVPNYASEGIQLFSIGSNKYAFNTKGEMQTGQKVVNLKNGEIANYYFGTSDDGAMKTGQHIIYNSNLGKNQTWYFRTSGTKKGQGYHGILDNTIYEYGLRKEADDNMNKAPVSLDGSNYLVNRNGTIQKASSYSKSSVKPELGTGHKDYKDSNGFTYVVDENGIIR